MQQIIKGTTQWISRQLNCSSRSPHELPIHLNNWGVCAGRRAFVSFPSFSPCIFSLSSVLSPKAVGCIGSLRCPYSSAAAPSSFSVDFPQKVYSKSHEYLSFFSPDGAEAAVGISAFAAEELGEIVFVDRIILPSSSSSSSSSLKEEKEAEEKEKEKGKGKERVYVNRGDPVCSLEAVKAVAEVYAPAAGEIIEFNQKIQKNPSLISKDPEGEGWIFKMIVHSPQTPADTPEKAAYTPEKGAYTPEKGAYTPEKGAYTPQSAQMAVRSFLLSPEAYEAFAHRQAEGRTEE